MQLNDIFEFDENYDKYVKFCNDNNYIIKEINVDNKIKYQICEYKPNLINDEYIELINWFNDYYSIHEQKYRRLNTLGNKEAYDELIKLYNEAEIKRARIQELEGLLDV